ncbi:hypothetical protein AB0I72_04315 [Nocardiopsis sp. NPDC049922]|uniref:hypothetical protein n=1 Tax=Nocardiopsis sp. NPDC049922 TaxID=3155157 RepID=UPI003406A212
MTWRNAGTAAVSTLRSPARSDESAARPGHPVRALLDRYAREPGARADAEAPGSRVVRVHFAAFPSPDPADARNRT